MTTTPRAQLTLPMAILININIMLGVGIFLNTTLLAQHAGGAGCVSYAVIGILLLPLVISMAQLLSLHPKGGFYTYGTEEINPFAGFMSAWSYFTAKLASATIMIHTSVLTIQQIIPATGVVHPFFIDCTIIALFVGLNLCNIKTGAAIQMAFTTFKAIPVFFVILSGMFLLNGANYDSSHLIWSGIPGTLPFVLYATMGFESACSLSSTIKNAHKNAPLAVLISYAIVLTIIILYQFFFYGTLGTTLAHISSYRESFPHLTNLVMPTNPTVAHKLAGLFNIAIASSALGGAYGILFSNSWNLHILANNNHTFFSRFFSTLNHQSIPFACVLIEGVLCITYLFASGGSQATLQQLASFGIVLTYTISVLSLIHARKKEGGSFQHYWIPALGLMNCLLLIAACIRGLILSGATGLSYFLILLLLGMCMFRYTRTQPSPNRFS
jgi:amino acid transporter